MAGLLAREEQGQGLVEYGIILAFISVAVMLGMIFVRDQLADLFRFIGNGIGNIL
jgi:Flp pilus assembly pilin Flp